MTPVLPARMLERLAPKACVVVAWAAAAVAAESFVVVIGWALATIASRNSFGEGEALFEAMRIRAGRPLYFDGVAGTLDYGAPATHYYVLYTPLWPAVLSLLPAAHALLVGRVVTTAAWLGLLALFVAMAPRDERRVVALFAVYFAGIYNLVIFATAARHDMVAVGFTGLALVRTLRARRVDALAGALFALGAWIKPSMLGLAGGAFLAQLLTAPGAVLPGLAGATAVSAACAFALDRVSGGVWFEHLLRSTAQPLSWANWLGSAQKDLLWFGAPVGFAAWAGFRTRKPEARLAASAVCVSTLWALFLGAKTGRGTNYWLEPCVGAVATMAVAAPVVWVRVGTGAVRALAAGVALFQALWVGVASNRSVVDAVERGRAHARIVELARRECTGGGGLVLSNDTGDELDLDGRIVMPSYQFSYTVLAGKAPPDVLVGVLEAPQARCYLEHSSAELRKVPAAAAVLEQDYVLRDTESEWNLFVHKVPPPA